MTSKTHAPGPRTPAFLCVLLIAAAAPAGEGPPDRVLRYDRPAEKWEREALPIGNGRLGAMIFGGTGTARCQFNEDSLWLGDEKDTGRYQDFGDLLIELDAPDAPGGYRRVLDITRAVHRVSYAAGGINYARECFASRPAEVIAFRFTADTPGAYTGRVRVTDAHGAETTVADTTLTVAGALKNGLKYAARGMVLTEGGTAKKDGDAITFTKADALTILLAADTNYSNKREKKWRGPDPHERIAAQLAAAAKKPYADLRAAHVADYRRLYDRFRLQLGDTPAETAAAPTDARLAAYKKGGADPDLEELLFQYARYLMIASSRPGALPANLQGLWNDSNKPPWRSDYHTDVNVQMNYWFVDHANISECFGPYAEWLWSIRGVRTDETKAHFGVRGWTMHAENGPYGGSTWKWVKPTAAWCAQNLWDHFAFTRDRDYLRERAYPIMKELCWFWEDMLKELPDGTLVSPEGYSPEHGPEGVDGVSHDQQLAWDLFTNYIEAAAALGVDADYRTKVAAMREKLLGPQIGRWGQLQEWMEDRDNPKDKHRHLSHLIAVHPGRQISPVTTPKLAKAAEVSMNARGDGSTGWSRAWKICIRARLHDGDHAYRILNGMIRGQIADNLFDLHPPFQIDGNFGYAAGICEMLVQSHMGWIDLLPALPAAWPDGRVTGIRARGDFALDVRWRDGKPVKATLRSGKGLPCRLRAPVPIRVTAGGRPVNTETADGIVTFPTKKGAAYTIVPAG